MPKKSQNTVYICNDRQLSLKNIIVTDIIIIETDLLAGIAENVSDRVGGGGKMPDCGDCKMPS